MSAPAEKARRIDEALARMDALSSAGEVEKDESAICAGHIILGRVYGFTGRFVAYPSEHAHVAPRYGSRTAT